MLPPALLDDETVQQSTTDEVNKFEHQAENPQADHVPREVVSINIVESQVVPEPLPGLSFKWDPYGRDAPRRNGDMKGEWSVEPLAKYLKRVAMQIDSNIETHSVPSKEKLDGFVARLVAHTQRLLKHAPKKMRPTLQGLISRRFQRFWIFARNEKVRSTNPEELKGILNCLVEALLTEYGVSPAALETQEGHLHVPTAHRNHRRAVVDPVGRVG
jgi:hypothetical protein